MPPIAPSKLTTATRVAAALLVCLIAGCVSVKVAQKPQLKKSAITAKDVSKMMPAPLPMPSKILIRHVIPPAVTNIVLTFFALDDDHVCLHTGLPNAWDIANATNQWWSSKHIWTIYKSTNLLNWFSWAIIDEPGVHQFCMTDTNAGGTCFYKVSWQ